MSESKTSIGKSEGGKSSESNNDNDLLDLTFDPSSANAAPSLRQPKLSEAQLLAALELGFSGKYLPSSVTGGEAVPVSSAGNSVSDRSNNKIGQASSMINNHSSSNINQNQGSGSQPNQYPLFVDNYSFNLTEEQQQGLLPPLRRPDINQLPPDVLAVLLKSTRFEEILIPTQRRLTEVAPTTNNNSRTTATEQDSPRGHPDPSPPNHNNSGSSAPSSAQSAEELKSTLSPFAKEFVPTSFQASSTKTTMNSNSQQDLAFAMSQVNVQGQNDSFHGLVEELDGSDCILSTVTDMISQVSQDPASLNRCGKVTVDVLKKYLNDDDTLGIVVTLLVEQMISNNNFCYSGAKILELLRENNIGVGENSIKKLVLTRMHEEFTHCLNNLDDAEVRNRALGVLRLLSELYMNFAVLPDSSKLHIFALAVLEMMEKLLQKDKSLDTVKCVCQLLKLIGYEVENSNKEQVREYFGLVLKELSYLRMTSSQLHPTCVTLVDMVFKLHSNKWNRGQEEPSAPSATSYAATMTAQQPIYYEMPDSDEDSYGDEGGIMIDDEPDDVQAAYEEFLKMSSK